jgi:carbonic anhydrase/acetyltransferase-like protein (isoleucine patch superfamily)
MVSGLTGTGLILRDNGGDELAVAHDGTFTFATQVEQGGTYDVSVLTQPSAPAQTCAISNGSGTATNNITDVAITCTTSSFTVGGTVVGLTGSGLVLQDNGGDDLHISANGAFTFTSQVVSGGTFAVTIETQPTSPAQTCSVLGNSGTIGNGNITTVVVNCSTDSFLIGGTVVGRGAEIGPGVRLDGAVIFDGVKIEAGSVIERSIIGFGVRVGPRALIRDGVIGDGADIGARCELLRGARVWPGVSIPDGGIRYSSDV